MKTILFLIGFLVVQHVEAVFNDTLSWDSQTVFLLNADQGGCAKTRRGEAAPQKIGGKEIAVPVRGSKGEEAWRLTPASALAYQAPLDFPSRNGTIETLVRPAEGQPPTADLQHLISLFRNRENRFL